MRWHVICVLALVQARGALHLISLCQSRCSRKHDTRVEGRSVEDINIVLVMLMDTVYACVDKCTVLESRNVMLEI